ncbi:MAG: cytochrome c maturation protein CcmE [Ilumatobacter sp.]|uniref:cytochrome c maturation protein CcmE n=1 Tax=Ilumatobacter sp. TaxID=1967498 RepID=UPI003C7771F5
MSDMDLTPRSGPGDDGVVTPKKKRNIVPMIVLALVFVGGGVIITQGLNNAVDYFCNVDEVGTRDGCEEGRRIRLQGTVEAGTIDKSVPGVTAFKMAFGDAEIGVNYDGIPGGIFKECIPVVVHGEIRDGKLEGDLVEVKHSDEYVAVNDENLAEADEYADAECPADAA